MISKQWTVTELTRYIRQMFEADYRLQELDVEGEVSDFRIPGSGHAYFTLKDENAQLRCVMWRSDLQGNPHRPVHGERVIATGYLSVYESSGQYQLYCRRLRPAGLGDLHARFEALKARLDAEGLFNPARKRVQPRLPRVIGIVTSPSAAALQDVLNILRRRYPIARCILSPTPVQGDQAPPQIVAALEAINSQPDIDVILLVRGGGSVEDLWCFNDERVARAVAASRVPVISGVGHETDFTLADFAADVRAPTPSAAAEMATPVTADDLRMDFHSARLRLINTLDTDVTGYRRSVDRAVHALRLLSPRARVDSLRQYLDGLLGRAAQAVAGRLALRRARLESLSRALRAFNPQEALARGYAIVRSPDGKIVRDAASVSPGDLLSIQLHRGRVQAAVSKQELGDDQ
jgi:exodeoxyribonuclease VII large subunit